MVCAQCSTKYANTLEGKKDKMAKFEIDGKIIELEPGLKKHLTMFSISDPRSTDDSGLQSCESVHATLPQLETLANGILAYVRTQR